MWFKHLDILNPFYLNPYSVFRISTAVLSCILGFCFFAYNRKDAIHRCFLYFTINLTMWAGASACLFNSWYLKDVLFWGHVYFAAITIMPATLYHFSCALTQNTETKKQFIKNLYFWAITLSLMNGTVFYFSGMYDGYFGKYPKAGPLLVVLVFFIAYCCTITFTNFVRYYFCQTAKFSKQQTRFLMITFLILQFCYIDVMTSYDIEIYPSGNIVLFCVLLILTCFMFRYSHLIKAEEIQQYKSKVKNNDLEIKKLSEELHSLKIRLMAAGNMSAFSNLTSGIMYQFNQPLNTLMGNIRFIKNEIKTGHKYSEKIRIMERQAISLKEILRDIKELVNRKEAKTENFNVNVLIKKLFDVLRNDLKIRRIKWECEFKDDLPEILGNKIDIQQVFLNVIMNAMQALSSLTIGTHRYLKVRTYFDDEKKLVCVSIKDSGCGISIEDQAQIFEPFYSTESKRSGTGLSRCQEIISDHGGNIFVESDIDAGANFVIQFPAIEIEG